MLERINRLQPPGGNTNTYEALRQIQEVFRGRGNRPEVKDVAFVITDGLPTLNIDRTEEEARRAQDAGIQMFAVGITDNVDENTLSYLSSPPRGQGVSYFISTDFSSLRRQVLSRLLTEACETTTPTTSTSTTTTPPPVSTYSKKQASDKVVPISIQETASCLTIRRDIRAKPAFLSRTEDFLSFAVLRKAYIVFHLSDCSYM